MAQHHTFFGKLFGWIGDLFHNANHTFLQTAIDVTQAVKDGLNSGIVDLVTGLIPGNIDNEIVTILRKNLPIILADEMLLQGINENSTEADVQALAKKIVDSFGGFSTDRKEEFYTSVAAKIYKLLKQVKDGQKVTFGEAASLAESMYQSWLQSQQAAA